MGSSLHESGMVHRHRDIQGGTARAAVFGINDGLVSNAALVLGVAAANVSASTVFLSGIAGLIAGASSMAAGEYISMKVQNELIEREVAIEKESIKNEPQKELQELIGIYMNRGLNKSEAKLLAEAIHRDPEVALEVHTKEELGISPHSLGKPTGSALSSFIAFSLGAYLPLIPWMFTQGDTAKWTSISLALFASALVGLLIARFTEKPKLSSAFRQAGVAALACGLTFVIGSGFGNAIG